MRTQHQDGWLRERGTRRRMYYGRFRSADGKEHSVVLGPKSCMTKADAREKLRIIIRRRTGRVSISIPDKNIPFERFVMDRWLPMKEGRWRIESTAVTNTQQIKDHIITKFQGIPLWHIDKLMLQAHLNSLAKKYSDSLVRHVRIFLKSIFSEAVDQEYIAKDPARHLSIPVTKDVDKTTLTWDLLRSVFESLTTRDQLIISIEGVAGLRPSELFVLRRGSFTGSGLSITETVYRGKLRRYGKTDGSTTTVDLPAELCSQVQQYLDTLKDKHTQAFMFPNSRGGFITKENYIRRVLKPVAESLELPKLNFQVLRRSFSTLAQKHGTVKDVQRQMRHASPDVTAHEYMQVIPESVRSMVSDMYAELMKKPETGSVQ